MFEVYRIGVRLSLINGVSSGLSLIASQFAATDKEAKALKSTLKKIKLMAISGAAIGGAGFLGLSILEKMVKPASEYAHQLNAMNIAGLKQKEIAEGVGLAWKVSANVLTSTATGNLKTLTDLRSALGDWGEAKGALPMIAKMQAVLRASKEGNLHDMAENLGFEMTKALDIIGAVRDPTRFASEASQMFRAMTAFNGRITPEQFRSTFFYLRQAKLPMSDEFKYQFLPTFMLESSNGGGGGGSRGVGPMFAALYRWTNQGFVNKLSLPELRSLGLLQGHGLHTTTEGTTVQPLTGAALAASNPMRWMDQVLMPAIFKKYGKSVSNEKVVTEINLITRGNQLAGSALSEMYMKRANFYRDRELIRKAMPFDQAYSESLTKDPETAKAAAAAQWDNLKTSLGLTVIPQLITVFNVLAETISPLTKLMREHESLAKGLVVGFGALSASLAFTGVLIGLGSAFRLLDATLLTLSGTGAAGAIPRLTALLGKGGLVTAAGAASLAIGFLIGELTAKALGIDDGRLGAAYYDKTHTKAGKALTMNAWMLDILSGTSRGYQWGVGRDEIGTASKLPTPYANAIHGPVPSALTMAAPMFQMQSPLAAVPTIAQKSGQPVQVNATMQVNERTLGTLNLKFLVGELNQAPSGVSYVDPMANPLFVNY